MTPFESSVSALMDELTRHSEAGLITYQALVLMGPVQQHLNDIKRLERKLADEIRQRKLSSPSPAQDGLKPSEN